MIAYKLMRMKKNGRVTPLHINRTFEVPLGIWLAAEEHPTKGFAVRKGWHSAPEPFVPHMKEDVHWEDRVWVEVELKHFTIKEVPPSQGGQWYLSQLVKHNRVLTKEEVYELRNCH